MKKAWRCSFVGILAYVRILTIFRSEVSRLILTTLKVWFKSQINVNATYNPILKYSRLTWICK